MSDHYILVGQTPVPVDPCDPYTPEGIAGLLEWARWFETSERTVFQTEVLGICWVSTIFMGLDASVWRGGPPQLFETMAFWNPGGAHEQRRCSTWLEAETQHREMCREAAKPRAVCAWLWRLARETVDEAIQDARRSWRELRGIPRTEMEQTLDRLRYLR